MNDDDRPNPEDLLKTAAHEEAAGKGRLKIFLGMAAGVGKTYSMLEDAQTLQRMGSSVAVGIVDAHGRSETAALVAGLNVIPPQIITYRGKEFQELNLDAIIALHPQVVLVDELAHSNIPGAKHAKRWQDVLEIIENGIDVYTTLNVQHIESLNDVVDGITGCIVRETVPDSIVERAAFIQLVDITPDELIQRLKEGKVYLGAQSQVAALNFFQKDRLTALREIVLRYAAEKVDQELHHLVSSSQKNIVWRAREKLLVAVSHSPHSPRLIRSARRLAFHLDAPWIAAYVNDGSTLTESENNQLAKNLSLARDLGAEVVTTNDPHIADALQRVARQKGVTQILLGMPPKLSWYNLFSKTSLLDTLARECSDIDIHVIRMEKNNIYKKRLKFFKKKGKLLPYFLVSLCVIGMAGLCWLVNPLVGYKVVGVIFLLGILSLSLFFKKGPIFFASFLYAAIWRFFFIPPTSRQDIYFNEDIGILALYFLTAIVTGLLVDRGREYKEMLAKREESAQSLYEILRLIVNSPSKSAMLTSIKERLNKLLNGKFEFIIENANGDLEFSPDSFLLKEEKERSIAQWVFDNGKEAGWSTATLPYAKSLFIPLKGYNEIVGVLAYRPMEHRLLNTEQKNFLYTVAQQLSGYLERTLSEERERQAESLKQAEKIYHTVLKSISSEFQHPLATMRDAIYEAFQALKYEQEAVSKNDVTPQIHKIETSSSGMLRMLDNVSIMAKLSSESVPMNCKVCKVSVLVKECVEKIIPYLDDRIIQIKIQEDVHTLHADKELLEIALINLLRNAVDYSPSSSTISIEVKQLNGTVSLSIMDEGPGIPENMQEKVFTEFYRIPGTESPGVGLGLSIAKKIAEMHHGTLTVENRIEGGAQLCIMLPN